VCCKIHNVIIDQRISREGDEIDLGAGWPAVSDSLNGVSGSPDVFCYKQYTRIFKTDNEMTSYRQHTGVLKSTQKWTLVLCKIVHSSRDRHSQSGYRVISSQELLFI
jgi:hypothetical protein